MEGLSAAQRRVLEALIADGPRTARELSAALGVTAVAIRQQLTALSAAGMAEPEPGSVAEGVGRPASRWRASDAAQGSIVDGHAALSTEILIALAQEGLASEGLVERVLARRTEVQLERYEAAAGPSTDLASRLETLARQRSEEGYMASTFTDEDGVLCLAENHCPLRCAVDSCLGLCSAELDLFHRFVGPGVSVQRTEHIASADRRCVYKFEER